jgi:ABC-type uncharacterized transport system fused permease/ATPase subunit
LGDFSILINQFESLSAFSAGLTRLSTFLDKLENSSWAASGYASSNSENEVKPVFSMKTQYPLFSEHHQAVLQVKNLTLLTPDGQRTLLGAISTAKTTEHSASDDGHMAVNGGEGSLEGINYKLERGDRVLVVGPSGAGKSSFIRAISGLWRVGHGEVTWFSSEPLSKGVTNADSNNSIESAPKDVFFLPQKPYNLVGSLREQIMYPALESEGEGHSTAVKGTIETLQERIKFQELDLVLLDILKKVNLDSLASRVGSGDALQGLGVESDWSKVLSLGEQQRLAFARVLYNKPTVVFLDGKYSTAVSKFHCRFKDVI